MHHVLHRHLVEDAQRQRQLLVVLIAAHVRQIVALGVEEQRVDEARGGFHRRRLARTQLVVDLDQRLIAAGLVAVLALVVDGGRVAGDGRGNALVIAEQADDLLVRLDAHGAQQHRHRQLAGAVDAGEHDAVGVGLVLDPRAAVGDHLGGIQRHAGLVDGLGIVDARRTNQLRDDDALRAVDDERAVLGHQREVSHEHLGFLDLMGVAVGQTHRHLQRRGVGRVALLALLDRVFRLLVQRIIRELEDQALAVVGDGRNIRQHLAKAFLQKALIGILLNFNQIGYCQRFLNAGKTHSRAFAHLHRMNHTFNHPYLHCRKPCAPKGTRIDWPLHENQCKNSELLRKSTRLFAPFLLNLSEIPGCSPPQAQKPDFRPY